MNPTKIEDGFKIAVLIPSYNQAATIGRVVRGFAEALPAAQIFVFDNNSTDDTARAAAREGASVRREARQGKGNVVRRMFADVEADIYVLADGDGSCDPSDAPSLVNALITERADMVVGTRENALHNHRGARPALGDETFGRLYRHFVGSAPADIASSYRAFTRRFVKSFPAISTGFDVAIELSMHASQLMIPVAEIEIGGGTLSRARGAASDGVREALRIAKMLAILLKEARPFAFYAIVARILWIAGLAMMVPILRIRLAEAVIPSFSNAFAGMSMFVAGFILAGCGLILDSLARSRIEQKRILFLTVPGLGTQ